MTLYETLCAELAQQEVGVYEVSLLPRIKGLYCDKIIWLNRNIETEREKACTLAEEQAHYLTSVGDILDQHKIRNRKQERLARRMAYEKLIPLRSFVGAYREGIRSRYEFAEYMDVTEGFLEDALSYYKEKHGLRVEWASYLICFEPLEVVELFDEA
ncbi:ImmA/IrrE family metallo-endopeptidase [Desulfitobacterium sp. PCE1]|uniref:ImmA/IrrE family metallo-endopeptidase n=1 Tax=Desulfitobacterium sp. PCE1 TaxID=146907 RepID=UPI000360FEA5|nr:ImmA/IrrE family metallo-endopeptidase [Desulfitobacterium sp. PCE1]